MPVGNLIVYGRIIWNKYYEKSASYAAVQGLIPGEGGSVPTQDHEEFAKLLMV